MTTPPLDSLRQHSASALQPGEEFLAGIHVHVPDYSRASKDALFGVVIGSVLAHRDQQRRQTQTETPIHGAGAFIGVTASRILVFAVGAGLHPKDLIGAVDRTNVTLDSSTYRNGLVTQARVRLLNGDRVILEGSCSAKNPDLDGLRALIPAPVGV